MSQGGGGDDDVGEGKGGVEVKSALACIVRGIWGEVCE